MRFQTSQTTPSFLDRRLQLRMLAFVGLISVIMVSLSVMNHRPRAEQDTSKHRAVESPDALNYLVNRETRSLKPGEFVAVQVAEDDGPRGQWSESSPTDRSRESMATRDQDLYQPRSKERSENGGLFRRRRGAPLNSDGPLFEADARSQNEASTEIDLRDRPPGMSLPPREQRSTSPQVDDDWAAISDSTTPQRDFENPRPPARRSLTSFDDQQTRDERVEAPFVDLREPFSLDRPESLDRRENRPTDLSPQDVGPRDDTYDQDRFSTNRRDRNSRADEDFDQSNGYAIGSDQPASVDLRRRDDLWGKPATDAEPFHEDFAAVRIDKRYLDVVKDNTLGIRRDESEVFYWLLDHSRRVSSLTLEKSGLREVQYVNLMTEPDRFRGEPITIEGDLWRLYEFDAGRNDYGINRIYEGWVFTGDSGNHPYRIVCTNLPKGIEPGENLRKPVRITGYFFKREGYRSNGGVHIAPVLLARRIGINPMPNGIPLTAGIMPYTIGALMAIGLAILVTMVGFAIGDERSSRVGLRHLRRQPNLSFANLTVPTPIPVEQTLRQLAERERELAISGAYGPLLSRQTLREHAVRDFTSSRQSSSRQSSLDSHETTMDADHVPHRRTVDVVQNWAARQQANQAELDALRLANPRPIQDQWFDRDDLNSDALAPANNILPQTTTVSDRPVTTQSFMVSAPAPIAHSTLPSHYSREAAVGISPIGTDSHSFVSQRHSVVTSPTSTIGHATNIEYRASKLSEWEDEVAKMATRPATRLPSFSQSRHSSELAASQIERDRLLREQEIRDRIHRQQLESERVHREQVEREQYEKMERERSERERMERERHYRDQHEHQRTSTHLIDDTTQFSLASSRTSTTDSHEYQHDSIERDRFDFERTTRDRHERERIERERLEHDRLERIRLEHERRERERLDHERHERERIDREYHDRQRLERERIERERTHLHREYDRRIDDLELSGTEIEPTLDDAHGSTIDESGRDSHSTVRKRRGGWGWPARKKNAATGKSETDSETTDSADGSADSTIDGEVNTRKSSTSSGWGRNRKRRKNLGDGGSA